MNQRTHAWIAIRAIKLLEDEGSVPRLIKLLKPFTREASIGAWIPDKRDSKLGGSKIQNHIFKIGVHTDPNDSRFIVRHNKLLARLGNERLISNFIDNHLDILDNNWWQVAYRADPPARKHLANRSMALSINIIDMLILGDPVVQARVPGRIDFISKVARDARCSPGQAALFFFMLSHFIADTLMPCHCDKRDLSDYAKGLHKELEAHWSRKIGTKFN